MTRFHEFRHLQKPLQWLNDEVVNYFFALLEARADRPDANGRTPILTAFFNSFFFERYRLGYAAVEKWSKKKRIKLLDFDKVFFPVHVNGNHWCLAVINFLDRRFEYYDSLRNRPGLWVFNSLREYVVKEAKNYHNRPNYNFEGWTEYVPQDIPHQDNGSDCGVYMCKYADYLSNGLDIPTRFQKDEIKLFRRRMLAQIIDNRY